MNERLKTINNLQREHFDLLIIGGGISGAGLALEAGLRGLNCALIEKADFASGTSSRSTKLIHGGLRYLKQAEFALVRETGRERSVLQANAPNLIHAEHMLLPFFRGGQLGPLTTRIGLSLYDRLAAVPKQQRKSMLNSRSAKNREPLLIDKKLLGAGLYTEYRGDDARLVLALLQSAVDCGVTVLNYCEAETLHYEQGKVSGLRAKAIETESFAIKAEVVVNAAGPWVDTVRKKEGHIQGKKLRLSRGVHFTVKAEQFPLKQSCYFDLDDGRMMFAIPREELIYFGTTDNFYNDDPSYTKSNLGDAHYLCHGINQHFKVQLKPEDLLTSWSGVRPLIYQEGKKASEISRRDELFISGSGLISMAGGKLTGYRKMAEKTIEQVFQTLGRKYCPKNLSRKWRLKHCTADIGSCFTSLPKVDEKVKTYLYTRFGQAASLILKNSPNAASLKIDSYDLLEAELDYCVENEYVFQLSDFLIRRTSRMWFYPDSIETLYEKLNQRLSQKLNLSEGLSLRSLSDAKEERLKWVRPYALKR